MDGVYLPGGESRAVEGAFQMRDETIHEPVFRGVAGRLTVVDRVSPSSAFRQDRTRRRNAFRGCVQPYFTRPRPPCGTPGEPA